MKIAAFNVKRLGWDKIHNDDVRTNLIKIVSRYTVVVILEVVGHGGRVMHTFLEELNSFGRNRHHPYGMKLSECLGRGSYREQFVFFYREDEVKVIDSYQHEEEEDKDVLAREPFILFFSCPKTVVQKLVLIPVHTKPEDTEQELDALDDVVKAVREKWKTNGRNRVRISYPPYHWLIDDDADTTTSNSTDHTYDRIVVYGDYMYDAVVPNSAQPFNFQRAYRLSDEITQKISDHYPVEVELEENQ